MEQRTDEWHSARLGKVTASKISAVMSKPRSGSVSLTRESYMLDLMSEVLTGQPANAPYSTPAIAWGVEQEQNAQKAYSFMTDEDVTEVGFIDHPAIEGSGASPDGLVGADGLIEIKCPNTATHLKFMETGKIDKKYICQMQWQMACTGRQWCDFVSYDPRAPSELTISIKRVAADREAISKMEQEVGQFLTEMRERIKNLEETNKHEFKLPSEKHVEQDEHVEQE